MSDLPTDAVRLLEVAREAMSPSDADRQRVRRNLMAATAALAAAGSAAHTSASLGASGAAATSTLKVSGAASAWLTGGAKWLLAAALTTTLAGTGYYTLREKHVASLATQAPAMAAGVVRRAAAQPTLAARASEGAELAGEPVQAALPSATLVDHAQVADDDLEARAGERASQARKSPRHGVREASLSAAATRAASPALPRATTRESRPTAAQAATPAVAQPAAIEALPTAAEPRLEAELALVRQASAALRAGRAQAALALLREHATRFPNGVLGEERDGLLALSLCASGDRSAERAASSFLARAPRSPLAARVRKSCPSTP